MRANTIPAPGEPWVIVSRRPMIMSMHLFDVARVRPLIPRGLEIVPILPGKTLGGLFLAEYGPGSSLEYRELGVMPARVAYGGTAGFWVSHMWVDDAGSLTGGRRIGIPKAMAHFSWDHTWPGTADVDADGRRILSVSYNLPLFQIPFRYGASAITVADAEGLAGSALAAEGGDPRVLRMANRMRARWGIARPRWRIPADSPLAELGIGPPLLGLVGTGVRGLLAVEQRVAGKLRA